MPYHKVDKSSVFMLSLQDIDARTNLTMYGPNCEVCDGFMMSFISRSELNPGRPYWFCYGYPVSRDFTLKTYSNQFTPQCVSLSGNCITNLNVYR